MNGLDLLILGVAAFAGVRGLRRGLGREAIGLGATVLLLFAGLPLAGPLGRGLVKVWWPAGEPYATTLGFLTLLLCVALLVAVLTAVWQRLLSLLSLGWLDAFGGALFGLAKATAVWLVIVAVLTAVPWPPVQRALAGSVAANAMRQALPGVYRQVQKVMPPSWSLPAPPARRKRPFPGSPVVPPWENPGAWREVRGGFLT